MPDKIDKKEMKGELKNYLKTLTKNTSGNNIKTFNSSNSFTTY